MEITEKIVGLKKDLISFLLGYNNIDWRLLCMNILLKK